MFSVNNVFFQTADYKTKFQGKEMLYSEIKYLLIHELSHVGNGFFPFSHCFLHLSKYVFTTTGMKKEGWLNFQNSVSITAMSYHLVTRTENPCASA